MNFLQGRINTENPVVKKLLGGVAWSVVGTLLSKLFLMFASIITVRLLGVDKNGEYGVINSTVLMFSTFAGLGLGTTATRFVAEYKRSDSEKCGRIIGMTNLVGVVSGVVMAVLLVLLSPWLAKEQLHASQLTSGLMLASVLLLTNTISTIQVSILSGFEWFKSIARLSIIQGVISLPIFVAFTYYFNVNGLILGNIVVACVMLFLYGLENHYARKDYGIRMDIKGARQEVGIMWKFSLPSMLSSIMVGPVIWIGNIFITARENGYFELGIFNAANQWRTVITFLPTAIGSVILPLIVANKKNDRLERINILLGWVIVCCFAIPMLAAPELIAWLYGKEYIGQEFNISLLLIVLTCCIYTYNDGIARNLVSNNLMWWGFLNNTFWGGTFLGVLWFIRDFGAIGISAAYLVAYFLTTFVFLPFYIRRGVVHRSLLVSKEIIFMWCALFIQMAATALTTNIIARILTLALSIIALWKIGKTMIKKEKLS